MRIHIFKMYSTIHSHPESILSPFIVVGINYRHADVRQRSLFTISSSNCHALLNDAKNRGVNSLFVVSTCNRTEIYAHYADASLLAEFLVKYSNGSLALFNETGFVKHGREAVMHLFKVAAGLDSQIVGDYEILAQLKEAIAKSRDIRLIGPYMDRAITFALQASKAVRTQTKLSKGTVSVSFAVIEQLRKIEAIQNKSVLLIGAGMMARAVAKNLKVYFPTINVTIINRTEATAVNLAASLEYSWASFESLGDQVRNADIIITAVNSDEPIIKPHFFHNTKPQQVFDLAMPSNTDPGVLKLDNVMVSGIDEISQVLVNTGLMRTNEIPKAEAILLAYESDFHNWLDLQKHVPLINTMKNKLYGLGESETDNSEQQQSLHTRVNQTVGILAMNLRYKQEKGCHYINAINHFLRSTGVNE